MFLLRGFLNHIMINVVTPSTDIPTKNYLGKKFWV